ncbi:MAG: type VI secretion system-associated protein TagF [Methylococcaceae bacterium]|nr:type VI secretion system-associated protein TagF [Methylococcaceae bacterium]
MEFIKPWDEWLQSAVLASREQMGENWLQTYLTSPLWRFVLSSGLCGSQRWAGVLMPSVDRVGRYFPLTIVTAVQGDSGLPDLLFSSGSWFDRIEDLALTALDNDFDLDGFETSLAGLRLPSPMVEQNDVRQSEHKNRHDTGRIAFQIGTPESGRLAPAFARLSALLLEKYIPSYSLWNTEGSERVEASLIACEGLPPVDAFSSFLTGGWQSHGWNIRTARLQTFGMPEDSDSGVGAAPATVPRKLPDTAEMAASSPKRLRWTSFGATDVGKKRKVNEDALLVDEEKGLWIVADGMGGHRAGNLASSMVTGSFADVEVSGDIEKAVAQICLHLKQVNRLLYLFAAEAYDDQVVGSTVVALTAGGQRCGFVWAGDSRIYCYRHGDLVRLTRDHAVSVEDVGLEHRNGDAADPDHCEHCNVITRAVGAESELELDHEILEAEEGDTFLLCSDGLVKEVSVAEIGDVLASGTPRQCVTRLMDLALDRGARDNVTAIVVQAKGA